MWLDTPIKWLNRFNPLDFRRMIAIINVFSSKNEENHYMKATVTIFIVTFLCSMLIGNIVMADDSAINEPQSADEYIQLGDSLFNQRQIEEARAAYTSASEIACAAGQNSQCTEAVSMIARTYLTVGEKEQGREYFAKVLETVNAKDPLGWSRYLSVRGRFEWQNGDNRKATETFKEMYDYCKTHNLPDRALDAIRMAAITGTPEEQVQWGLKGIQEAEAADDTAMLGPLWNNLGATYDEQGMYKECLEAYLKAREYHYLTGSENAKLIADWAVGHAYRLNGDFKQAEKIMKPLEKKFEELDNGEFVGWTLKELGHIEMEKKHFQKAVELYYKALDKLEAAGVRDWGPQYYKEISDLILQAKLKYDQEGH